VALNGNFLDDPRYFVLRITDGTKLASPPISIKIPANIHVKWISPILSIQSGMKMDIAAEVGH
jgi:hypothetical protein